MKWQPMETSPRDETFVLLRTPDTESGVSVAFYSWFEDGEWWESEASGNPVLDPQAWAPLPRNKR